MKSKSSLALAALLALHTVSPAAFAQTARRKTIKAKPNATRQHASGQKTNPKPAHQTAPVAEAQKAASNATPAHRANEPNATIDELFSAGSYSVYFETRSLVEQLESSFTKDLLVPLRDHGVAPPEMEAWMQLVRDNRAELLQTRIAVAILPGKKSLPQYAVAIETASPADAARLEPQIKGLAATLTESFEKSFGQVTGTSQPSTARQGRSTRPRARQSRAKNAASSYRVQRFGQTLLITDKPTALTALRPANSLSLAQNARFREMQSRFGNEQFFIYSDFKAVREFTEQQRRETLARMKEQAAARGEVSSSRVIVNKVAVPPSAAQQDTNQADAEIETTRHANDTADDKPTDDMSGVPTAVPVEVTESESIEREGAGADDQSGNVSGVIPSGIILGSLFGGFTRGFEKMDAIGAGYSLRDGAMTFRVLAASEDRIVAPIPFFPFVVSGASVTPQTPAMLPADTGVFASLSLDFPRIYDELVGVIDNSINNSRREVQSGKSSNTKAADASLAARIAALEAKHDFNLREEIAASLGDEIAVGMSSEWLTRANNSIDDDDEKAANQRRLNQTAAVSSSGASRSDNLAPRADSLGTSVPEAKPADEIYVMVALRDKARFQRLIPHVAELFGIPLPKQLNPIERRDGYETLAMTNGMVSFIGDHLVITPDPAALPKLLEAARKGSTLASNTNFTGARSWQQTQKIGELYVASAVVKRFMDMIQQPVLEAIGKENNPFQDETLDLAAVTYLMTRDGLGAAHEVRIPQATITQMSRQSMLAATHQELIANDAAARSVLYQIFYAQENLRSEALQAKVKVGADNEFNEEDLKAIPYASLAELKRRKLISDEMLNRRGYQIEMRVTGDSFEATATPELYGKSGRRSFYMDGTGILRGGDTGGSPATVSDKRIRF